MQVSQDRALLSAADVAGLLRDRSQRMDEVVQQAFARHLAPVFGDDAVAFAVGGFGRRELFPYSDVDLLLLTRPNLTPAAMREPLGVFLRELWDAGLRISHSVHTVDECRQVYEQNVELSISLLDRRPITAGDALAAELDAAIGQLVRVNGKTLARMLAQSARARHAKYQGTIFHLEPNIKESPGALRDMQTAAWLGELMDAGRETGLQSAWEFIAPVRWFLHEASRRDDNLLSFEMQDAMSADAAAMMREYYRQAREVFAKVSDALETAEQSQPNLLRQFRDWRSRLSNSEFTVVRDRVLVRAAGQLGSDAALVWRLIEFVARHGIAPSSDVQRRLRESSQTFAEASTRSPLWPQLKSVLELPHAAAALRVMHNAGLISAIIPEWANIDCLVVRDFYHRYTVDEHTLVAIEVLEHIPDARFRDLLYEVPDSALLRMALLLHDAGKGSGQDHVRASADLSTRVGERLGISAPELDAVRHLIASHLELSKAMSSRDLHDAHTAQLLAGKVGTVERLKMLTLMTYADITAVNPSAMTPWRADQLWRAYLAAYEELTSELETQRIHHFDGADPVTSAFVEGLPNRYLRTHPPEEIKAHAALADQARKTGVVTELKPESGYWRLVVAAQDHSFLFASIAGALSAFGMNILRAEAFANASGTVLDCFTFADPSRTLELNPPEVDRLRDTVSRVVSGKQDVKRLLAGRRKAARPSRIAPRVAFNNKASQAATLIEIVAPDRPGLLYDLASTISGAGCDITVVLIDTEANKALDVFYVTAGGSKLCPEKEEALRRDLIEACEGTLGSPRS